LAALDAAVRATIRMANVRTPPVMPMPKKALLRQLPTERRAAGTHDAFHESAVESPGCPSVDWLRTTRLQAPPCAVTEASDEPRSAETNDWTEPGAFEVASGVYRVPLPLENDALRAVNVYLIPGASRIAMVDAGTSGSRSADALRSALASVGAQLGDVQTIAVTHIHHDHYGQAASIRRASGARVFLGNGEALALENLRDRSAQSWSELLARLRSHGGDELVDAMQAAKMGPSRRMLGEWEAPDVFIDDGARIPFGDRHLVTVATPGHTTGHVNYLDTRAALLFAGDHVLPHITPSIGVEFRDTDLPLGHFLTSLVSVRELPVTLVLPAHGPVFADLRGRVDELLAHHAERLRRAVIAVGAGPTTAYDAARRLPWTRRERKFRELDLFNQRLALGETIAHLDLLAARGELVRRVEDGIFTYAPCGARPGDSG
jgi:glyoxylase-like metal-dependent hydrolase (beta-lactamase superfamily II)